MDANGSEARLLPWATPDGKPCYLSSEGGFLSRMADDMEAEQLDRAADLLDDTRKALNDPLSPHAELRHAGLMLAESLADVLRVAESRGRRIPEPDNEGGTGEGPKLPAGAFG
ncbi:hypothetical protein NLX86_14940 [Streptomyces sp. A3M-1-3]|uniref:hypothetical protein n=1 Tax=Streptomyces sp. A3M-1-3 TaxID=2962044 RepID=UPI0020B6E1DD|nr:hypothetical protein [Streptomyces sp. A3M-1-3]MCP3819352.1 hypothetical protein [Streptomyces sp. A3M-1-3]